MLHKNEMVQWLMGSLWTSLLWVGLSRVNPNWEENLGVPFVKAVSVRF